MSRTLPQRFHGPGKFFVSSSFFPVPRGTENGTDNLLRLNKLTPFVPFFKKCVTCFIKPIQEGPANRQRSTIDDQPFFAFLLLPFYFLTPPIFVPRPGQQKGCKLFRWLHLPACTMYHAFFVSCVIQQAKRSVSLKPSTINEPRSTFDDP
jgi:hypothetical protein